VRIRDSANLLIYELKLIDSADYFDNGKGITSNYFNSKCSPVIWKIHLVLQFSNFRSFSMSFSFYRFCGTKVQILKLISWWSTSSIFFYLVSFCVLTTNTDLILFHYRFTRKLCELDREILPASYASIFKINFLNIFILSLNLRQFLIVIILQADDGLYFDTKSHINYCSDSCTLSKFAGELYDFRHYCF